MKQLRRPGKSVTDILEILKSDNISANTTLDIDSTNQILTERETLYATKVLDSTLFEIDRIQTISPRVNKGKIIKYYEYRLLNKPNGRKFYEEVLLSSPHNICPYCNVRIVKTVDHFLPKSEYPSYSITPINLVPSCRDCNTEKKIAYPTCSDDQTFHPYFDVVNDEKWIAAGLMQIEPLSFQFKVIKLDSWSNIKFNRAKSHFLAYNINQLFSNEADRELRGMQAQFRNLYFKNPNLLKEHIEDTFNTCRIGLGILDWKTIMYHELLNNDWFLNGCPGNTFFSS